ncbi:hypothetical protein NLX62_07925, partial [Mycobacteriaceae bacterium Msp059]|nr:hypothetical protein [Mycobacteriaceae bacterium Msp059]
VAGANPGQWKCAEPTGSEFDVDIVGDRPRLAAEDHPVGEVFGLQDVAGGHVHLNSIFQVIMFAVLGWFYLSVLPSWLGLEQTTIDTSPWQIAKSVLIFLSIPLLAGYL